MTNLSMPYRKMIKLFFLPAILLASVNTFSETKDSSTPFQVSDGLFDLSRPDSFGLANAKGMKHHKVFTAQENISQYNHGAVIFSFKNNLFIQWQSSEQDEDAPETRVLYSQSQNGRDWGSAKVLVEPRKNALVTNGGWWSDGTILVAYINVWPQGMTPKSGHVEYITSEDGIKWSAPKPLLDATGKPVRGVIEQDLKQLPNGRILTALHQQPGLIAKPFYTDDPQGIKGWKTGEMKNLPHKPEISRELEPSWFLNEQGHAVMIFRDQGSSFKVLASKSIDNGATWSTPIQTNMPDSRAKQSAGNFPDGTAYMVNNPSGSKERLPLVLTTSDDGQLFNKAFLLRSKQDLSPMRYEGKYKRIGYSYPKSMVWNNQLWISYAENKEDIWVTTVDLDE